MQTFCKFGFEILEEVEKTVHLFFFLSLTVSFSLSYSFFTFLLLLIFPSIFLPSLSLLLILFLLFLHLFKQLYNLTISFSPPFLSFSIPLLPSLLLLSFLTQLSIYLEFRICSFPTIFVSPQNP